MNTPYELERAAELMQCAGHVQRIRFYTTKTDNKDAELHCRIFGLGPMTKEELDTLAEKFNELLQPWLVRTAADLKHRALVVLNPPP